MCESGDTAEAQRHRGTRDTETQRHRDTETQRHRDTEIQRHHIDTAETPQRHRDTETQQRHSRDTAETTARQQRHRQKLTETETEYKNGECMRQILQANVLGKRCVCVWIFRRVRF